MLISRKDILSSYNNNQTFDKVSYLFCLKDENRVRFVSSICTHIPVQDFYPQWEQECFHIDEAESDDSAFYFQNLEDMNIIFVWVDA